MLTRSGDDFFLLSSAGFTHMLTQTIFASCFLHDLPIAPSVSERGQCFRFFVSAYFASTFLLAVLRAGGLFRYLPFTVGMFSERNFLCFRFIADGTGTRLRAFLLTSSLFGYFPFTPSMSLSRDGYIRHLMITFFIRKILTAAVAIPIFDFAVFRASSVYCRVIRHIVGMPAPEITGGKPYRT